MNTKDIAKVVSGRLGDGTTQAQVRNILEIAVESILSGLWGEGKVKVAGLGTFRLKSVPGRMGRNPKTGEKVWINDRKSIRFKAEKGVAGD